MITITPNEHALLMRTLRELENLTVGDIKEGYLSGAEQDGHHDEGYQLSKRTSAIQGQRASQIADVLAKAKVVTPAEQNERVALGTGVRIMYGDTESFFVICGYAGIYSDNRMMSATSPLGRALIGKRVGDDFRVMLPKGEVDIEILEILSPGRAIEEIALQG